jgi:hypothetical protein
MLRPNQRLKLTVKAEVQKARRVSVVELQISF